MQRVFFAVFIFAGCGL